MMRDPVIFWFNNPPKVGKGAFNYLANNWQEKVIYVFLKDFRSERKNTGWNDGDFGKAEIIELFNSSTPECIISEIFEKYPNAIHIVNGLCSPVMKAIYSDVKLRKITRLVFLSERPVVMGSRLERILRLLYFQLKYRILYLKLRRFTSSILALGGMGKRIFQSYGWEKDRVFPFMYCPPLKNTAVSEWKRKNNTVRFVYVGRFLFKTKGVDILMKAADRLSGQFQIDLVGGYGTDAKKVIDWANKKPYANFIGSWQSDEVGQRLKEYDVVVIPSRYDGWNLLVNEAVHSCVPVIVSDGAVSDEIVKAFGCGTVVRHNSKSALAKEMQKVIDHPNMIGEWSRLCAPASKAISPDIVGQYLIHILNYNIYNIGSRPICPWS